ncbi:unnamed protein product [Amoebophrya sp. A25]|nr:unnamed protein product [Amoebophrya sp. A25]|eukprot:GSA25T00010981001.1
MITRGGNKVMIEALRREMEVHFAVAHDDRRPSRRFLDLVTARSELCINTTRRITSTTSRTQRNSCRRTSRSPRRATRTRERRRRGKSRAATMMFLPPDSREKNTCKSKSALSGLDEPRRTPTTSIENYYIFNMIRYISSFNFHDLRKCCTRRTTATKPRPRCSTSMWSLFFYPLVVPLMSFCVLCTEARLVSTSRTTQAHAQRTQAHAEAKGIHEILAWPSGFRWAAMGTRTEQLELKKSMATTSSVLGNYSTFNGPQNAADGVLYQAGGIQNFLVQSNGPDNPVRSARTRREYFPYLQIDLGKNMVIESVELYSRDKKCASRFFYTAGGTDAPELPETASENTTANGTNNVTTAAPRTMMVDEDADCVVDWEANAATVVGLSNTPCLPSIASDEEPSPYEARGCQGYVAVLPEDEVGPTNVGSSIMQSHNASGNSSNSTNTSAGIVFQVIQQQLALNQAKTRVLGPSKWHPVDVKAASRGLEEGGSTERAGASSASGSASAVPDLVVNLNEKHQSSVLNRPSDSVSRHGYPRRRRGGDADVAFVGRKRKMKKDLAKRRKQVKMSPSLFELDYSPSYMPQYPPYNLSSFVSDIPVPGSIFAERVGNFRVTKHNNYLCERAFIHSNSTRLEMQGTARDSFVKFSVFCDYHVGRYLWVELPPSKGPFNSHSGKRELGIREVKVNGYDFFNSAAVADALEAVGNLLNSVDVLDYAPSNGTNSKGGLTRQDFCRLYSAEGCQALKDALIKTLSKGSGGYMLNSALVDIAGSFQHIVNGANVTGADGMTSEQKEVSDALQKVDRVLSFLDTVNVCSTKYIGTYYCSYNGPKWGNGMADNDMADFVTHVESEGGFAQLQSTFRVVEQFMSPITGANVTANKTIYY